MLPALPEDPSGELQGLLYRAERKLARLDGAVSVLPSPELFAFLCVRKEAVLSRQIEGMQRSLRYLFAAEAGMFGAALPREVDEVLSCVYAMTHGLERLADLPVSIRLVRDVHEKRTGGVRRGHPASGELRTSRQARSV